MSIGRIVVASIATLVLEVGGIYWMASNTVPPASTAVPSTITFIAPQKASFLRSRQTVALRATPIQSSCQVRTSSSTPSVFSTAHAVIVSKTTSFPTTTASPAVTPSHLATPVASKPPVISQPAPVPVINKPIVHPTTIHAVWLWNTSTDLANPVSVVQFCQTHGLNQVYLQINADVPSATYSAFILDAHQAGIGVTALDGNPSWALAADQSTLLSRIQWVAQYNASVPAVSQFHAIQFDIEPYLLSQWNTNSASVIAQWTTNITTAVQAAHGAGLQLMVTVPFWLDQFQAPNGQPLGLWMSEATDATVVMAYRSSGATVLAVAAQALANGSAAHRPVIIGVDLTASGPTTSFADRGAAVMVQQLIDINASLASSPSYAGWSVNDYSAWTSALLG